MSERSLEQPCPGTEALSRGLGEETGHPFQAHLDHCLTCAREVASLRSFLELARQLPSPPDGVEDLEERRTQMLALAASTPAHRRGSRRSVMVASLAVAAAVAIVSVAANRSDSSKPRVPLAADHAAPEPSLVRRAIVRPEPGTSFTVVGGQPDEIVRLRDGTVLVEVASLHLGERFRVVTGDAEVEVRGTAFEVVVVADRLHAVRVRHGRVEVRRGADPPVVLSAGQRWDAEPVIAPIVISSDTGGNDRVSKPVTARPDRPKPVDPPTRALPPGPVTSPAEVGFQEGVAALNSGNTSAAATAFERAIAMNANGPLAEDSRFWLAVARGRGGQRAGAIRAFEDYLALHPRSVRAGKASAMLGWLLLEGKDLDGAKRRFQAAIADPAEDVRASAQAGLAEISFQSP